MEELRFWQPADARIVMNASRSKVADVAKGVPEYREVVPPLVVKDVETSRILPRTSDDASESELPGCLGRGVVPIALEVFEQWSSTGQPEAQQ
jgi:hypothetical protein